MYIFDLKEIGKVKEVLKVDPKEHSLTKWSAGDDFVWGPSVAYESNVILTVCDRNKLPEGKLIREISLPSDAMSISWFVKAVNLMIDIGCLRKQGGNFEK